MTRHSYKGIRKRTPSEIQDYFSNKDGKRLHEGDIVIHSIYPIGSKKRVIAYSAEVEIKKKQKSRYKGKS